MVARERQSCLLSDARAMTASGRKGDSSDKGMANDRKNQASTGGDRTKATREHLARLKDILQAQDDAS